MPRVMAATKKLPGANTRELARFNPPITAESNGSSRIVRHETVMMKPIKSGLVNFSTIA
jgi:hypothetical protein